MFEILKQEYFLKKKDYCLGNPKIMLDHIIKKEIQ